MALIKTFQWHIICLVWQRTEFCHCFSNDVICNHWDFKLAYFVEHKISYQPCNFQSSRWCGSNLTEGVENTPKCFTRPKSPVLLGSRLSLPGSDSSTISDRLTHCSLSHKKWKTSCQGTSSPTPKKYLWRTESKKFSLRRNDKLIMYKDLLWFMYKDLLWFLKSHINPSGTKGRWSFSIHPTVFPL